MYVTQKSDAALEYGLHNGMNFSEETLRQLYILKLCMLTAQKNQVKAGKLL